MEIKNAKIVSTSIGYEDHGIMTILLSLDYGGAGQSFGGYALDKYDEEQKERVPSIALSEWIEKIIEVVGVDKWESLPGKYIRVEAEHSKVHAIGNLMEDKWFRP